MQIARNPLLSVEARRSDGRIELATSGPLSPAARPVVEMINGFFAREKPIPCEPDEARTAPPPGEDEALVFSTWIPPIPGQAFERMIMAEIGAAVHRWVPDQLSIAIIRGCPNRCIHCAAPSRTGDILTEETIRRVIGESLDLGTYHVAFDGGEPMLRRELPDLAAVVDGRAITSSFTSGYGLSEDLARSLKKSGLFAVRVSIDSPRADEHDRVRGREGAFSDALSGVKNALNAGLLVDLFMVVSPHNIDRLEEVYSLAADLGAHELSLYEIVAVGRWRDHYDETLSDGDIARLKRFHTDKNSGKGGGPRVTAFPYLLSPEMFGCFAGRRWIHVDASGEALPCAYMPLGFGNVRDKSLRDIWKEMSRYRGFAGKCACRMRDAEWRRAHPKIFETGIDGG